MRVAILGASPKTDRYAHKAQELLKEYGHEVFPVNPAHALIAGDKAYPSLDEVPRPVDAVTLYVGPAHSTALAPAIVAARPRCVILNPGTENSALTQVLDDAGIHCVEACTLVLLRVGDFDQTVMGQRH